MTISVHGDEHGGADRRPTAVACVGPRGTAADRHFIVSVRMRPQSPEEEQRSAAAIRLFLAAITREHIERRMKEGEP